MSTFLLIAGSYAAFSVVVVFPLMLIYLGQVRWLRGALWVFAWPLFVAFAWVLLFGAAAQWIGDRVHDRLVIGTWSGKPSTEGRDR